MIFTGLETASAPAIITTLKYKSPEALDVHGLPKSRLLDKQTNQNIPLKLRNFQHEVTF